MSRFRCYVRPFNNQSEYETDFTEITEDVLFNGLGKITQNLEDNEFDVGIFKYSDFRVKLRNDHGRYSGPAVSESIFKRKIRDSEFKLTWQPNDHGTVCGSSLCGYTVLNPEVTVFKGLLSDEIGAQDIDEQVTSLLVLGKDSILDRVEVPFNEISNGDNLSDIAFTILNQIEITTLLTVDAGNISLGLDQAIDEKEDFENQTVKEALDDILRESNSVLYIKDDTIYIKDRRPSGSSKKTFYGQASNNGIENIVNIKKVRTGINKMFNLWTWEDTSLSSRNADSINDFGIRKKEINFPHFTNNTKIQNILDSYKDEFGLPKQNFDLTTFVNNENLNLSWLDLISADYPTVLQAADGADLPIYGQAIYGQSSYPYALYNLTLIPTDDYRIQGITIDPKDQLMTFKVRRD